MPCGVVPACGGLLPHRFALTTHVCHTTKVRRTPFGGLFSVALSVGSRRPGVTWHLALWSPDFPRRIAATRLSWPAPPWRIVSQRGQQISNGKPASEETEHETVATQAGVHLDIPAWHWRGIGLVHTRRDCVAISNLPMTQAVFVSRDFPEKSRAGTITLSDGAADAGASTPRARPACRSAWWTDSNGPATFAARANQRRG